MKLCWLIPFALVFPLPVRADGPAVSARVATVTINPNEVTTLHLRPEFESTIRLPEEITSVILGSPGTFKAEHSEAEPRYVYVKPIVKEPAQSNLLIATKSGEHVTLELISDGASVGNSTRPVDFLLEYRTARSLLISSDRSEPTAVRTGDKTPGSLESRGPSGAATPSALQLEFDEQVRINAPKWTKWDGQVIETAVGDIRQWGNETVISYSIYNNSDRPTEIVPPQIQVTGRKIDKKKKQGKGIISDQLEIRDYKLSATRLEAGSRADGVVVFDRPNFKQSTERLFLQLAQADQVDRPILIPLPFTPPVSADSH